MSLTRTSRLAVVVAVAVAGPAVVLAAPAPAVPARSTSAALAARQGPSRLAPAAAGPERLRGVPAGANQLVLVTNPTQTSFARLTAFERVGGRWRVVLPSVAARIGLNGFARPGARRQGSYTTPTGVFSLGPAFGNGPAPRSRMRYRVVAPSDTWVYDPAQPATYNTYQQRRDGGWSSDYEERLAEKGAMYRYVVSIGYNHPVGPLAGVARPHSAPGVSTRAGGGIFLHVTGGHLGGATAGCVSVAPSVMRRLLGWLAPSKHPVIAMGTASDLLRPGRPALRVLATATVAPPATLRLGTSRGGRPIVATHLGPTSAPRVLVVVGVIHGNERAGRRVVEVIRAGTLPRGLQVWLVPALNPDGYARDVRTNTAGVDLNRNFPYAWRRARGGPNDSGPSRASEPETRAMMAFLAHVRPSLVVIFHQPLNGVDAYGAKSRATISALSAASLLPVGRFDCHGGCHGTLTQWFNHGYRGQAVTIEFGSGTPRSRQIARVGRAVLSVAASGHVPPAG